MKLSRNCGQLLFENSFVLACPNLEGLFGIYVVAKESYFKDGTLHEYFKKRNLKPGQPNYLYKHIYEECCYYTITAKLAPKWNMISNYLVRGRDFLTATNAIDAMHLTININNKGDTSFGFQISRIKLASMTLDKLDLHKSKLAELNSKKFVELKKYETKTIRVLPSLKRGNIVSISKTIHENCAIKNYNDMKRHWKNTYGYRLPETDDAMFYMEVSFFNGSFVFTYPSVCVRPYEPVFMQRVDPGPVVAVFMADLLKTVPTILGDTYKVPSHLSAPNHELNAVSQPTSYPNATAVEDRPEPKYRHNISATQNSAFALLPTQKPIPQTSNNEQRSKLTQLVAELKNPEHKTSKYITQKTSKSINLKYTPVLGIPKITQNTENNSKNSVVRQELKSQMDFLNNCVAQRSKIGTMLPKNEQDIITENGGNFVPKFTNKITTNVINKETNTSCEINSIENSAYAAETPTTSFNQNVQSRFESISKKVPMKNTLNGTVDVQLTNKSTMADSAANRDRKQPAFIVNQMKDRAKHTQNMNVPEVNKTIDTLTAPTLVQWLRENSVKCNLKEKKCELILKVFKFYQNN
ncbi:hypothetical protein CBL_05815 [Carabus blaptoides fortunei]